jgi:hypothetical protein
MIRSYLRLLMLLLAGSAIAPLITILASRYMQDRAFPWNRVFISMLIVLTIMGAVGLLWWFLSRFEDRIERVAHRQALYLMEEMPEQWVAFAIFVSAAMSLFLELSIIRWQASVFPFFAFYKNLSLLSCFAGLGLGYSLGTRNRVPLFLTLPLLCWQFLFMVAMRYGLSETQIQSLYVLPFREQLNMGLPKAAHAYYGLQTYYLLTIVFLLTALAFMPIGQLCGTLLERRKKLFGYGLNLLGSLAGVLLIFAVSAFWTPPTIWFLIAFSVLLCFYVRKPSVLFAGAGFAVLALIILDWPVSPTLQKIYSPYQLLEVGRNPLGLMEVRAAGHYYQKVFDFSDGASRLATNASLQSMKNYYDLPYQIVRQPKNVAIVGAGTGNDVAAAIRGGAERVDAIEIDPAILALGRDGHPEHPYSNPHVHGVVNDARTFLRNTDQHYDLIVFGLLDSHTLLSQASSVRLDSFVYTIQAMREARARLNPHGIISLAFSVMNDPLGRKIYLMLQQAFDGRPPLCIRVGYDAGVVFLESRDGEVQMPTAFLSQSGFSEISAIYANPTIRADVSTDDWPFFYMPQRVYPFSYLFMVALVIVLTLILIRSFMPERVGSENVPFFLLGAGFMLIETKNITELGLTFGNSWQVIGVVIAGIMVMAYLANLLVQHYRITKSLLPYAFLIASLAFGWSLARNGGFSSTRAGSAATVLLVTVPLFFSGIVFSILLKNRGHISGAMSANLFGAMCGGLLEYNSMYFGFQFLYLMAAGLYFLAFIWEIWPRKSGSLASAPASATTLADSPAEPFGA